MSKLIINSKIHFNGKTFTHDWTLNSVNKPLVSHQIKEITESLTEFLKQVIREQSQ